jgi:rhodanese-related sulfurtransferase
MAAYAKQHCDVIGTAELAELIASGADMMILDARPDRWQDGRCIPGARRAGPELTDRELEALIGAKDRTVVVYGARFSQFRCAALLDRLERLGYGDVREYSDGFEAWRAWGAPVAKGRFAAGKGEPRG